MQQLRFPWQKLPNKILFYGTCAGLIVLLFAMACITPTNAEETGTTENPSLTLLVEPSKRIFSSREGLMVKFTLKAAERTKVCIERDILSQLTLNISRSGELLPIQPLVVKDNRQLFREQMKIRWLESGESLSFRANIKRIQFANGEPWEPGEYNVTGSFGLCEQTPDQFYDPAGEETPVRSKNSGWFMIMS